MTEKQDEPMLRLDDVEVYFESSGSLFGDSTAIKAVDGVSLDIHENDVVALVGESGCGKTTLGKAAVALERPTGGAVRYRGQDIWTAHDGTGNTKMPYERIRQALQIIHQDPDSSLNPNRTVQATLAVPLKQHRQDLNAQQREKLIRQLLERLGVQPAVDYAQRYPHQLSGGEQQRVALGQALLMQPDLILADEAVSALDVSLRVEMMNLLLELQDIFDTSFLFISHDFAPARYLVEKADGRIGVMYLGKLVEIGSADEIIKNAKHPYTKVLVWSTPSLHPETARAQSVEEPPVRNIDIPDPENPPSGCNFHTRCPAIIPPEEMDIEQETYNEIIDFRLAIQERTLDVEQAWADLDINPEAIEEGEWSSNIKEFVTTLREREFDVALPESHRAAIDDASRSLAADDWESAVDTLRNRYESRCERDEPPLYSTDHQPVACHLYE